MNIGDVKLENPYILAPMAGVTDLPFRLLCKEQGAGLLCMEMISAKALQYKNKNTKALLSIHPKEYPVSLQLFGSDADIISRMAQEIEELPFQILDINMGCPVPKVVKNGEGSALMNRPELVYEIVSKTVKAIKKPVTVKIRKGFDETSVNAPEIYRPSPRYLRQSTCCKYFPQCNILRHLVPHFCSLSRIPPIYNCQR